MRYKVFVLYILVIVILSGAVIGRPPIERSLASDSLIEIRYPQYEFYPYGHNVTLPFHVFNSSGYALTNETTDCLIHIYDKYGVAFVEENLTMMDNLVDFYYELSPEQLNYKGLYSYIIQCNNTEQAGYLSTFFEISDEKFYNTNNENNIALIIGIALVVALFLYFGLTIDRDHFILKLVLIFFSLFTMILIPATIINGAYPTAITFQKIPLAFFVIFSLYFIGYLFYYWMLQSERMCKRFNIKR